MHDHNSREGSPVRSAFAPAERGAGGAGLRFPAVVVAVASGRRPGRHRCGSQPGDPRTDVSIDLKVKQALTAVLGVLDSDAATLGLPAGLIPKGDALKDVSAKTLSATLTITRGHYTKLSVPFAGLAALDAHPSSPVPPLGKSAVVLQFDDSAAPVSAPTNVSSFDVGALLDQFVNQFSGVGAAPSLQG